MGMRHAFSIADKHANGVERTIGELVRHLRAIVYDESKNGVNQDVFSDPSWLDSVQYILNSEVNSETGFSPFMLTFGEDASRYMTIAKGNLLEKPHARLSKLNANLVRLNESSKQIQHKLISSRKAAGVLPDQHNMYQSGDYVEFDAGAKVVPKMSFRYKGPFCVQRQVANDVTCQHMATGEVKKFDVSDLRLYSGDKEQAEAMARRDQDQHIIDRVLSCTGNPMLRTSMVFKVKFLDGDILELPYSKDLFSSIPYEEFCSSRPYLRHLRLTVVEAGKFINEIKKNPLTGFVIKQVVYLDIRVYGDGWFNDRQLPDTDNITYVSKFIITKVSTKKLDMINPLTKEHHRFAAYDIYCYIYKDFDGSNMVVIDETFMLKYPQVTQSE